MSVETAPAPKLARYRMWIVPALMPAALVAAAIRFWPDAPEPNAPRLDLSNLHGDTITAVAFSPGGTGVATASRDGSLKLIDAKSGRRLIEWSASEPTKRSVWPLVFTKDGKTLVASSLDPRQRAKSARSQSPKIRAWNVATGKLDVDRVGTKKGFSFQLLDDDKTVAMAGADDAGGDLLVLHKLAGSEPAFERSIPTQAVGGEINEVSVSPDGKWLVASGWKAPNIPLIEIATGNVVRTLPGRRTVDYSSSPFLTRFSPDGRILLVSRLNTVDLYEVSTGAVVASLPHADDVVGVSFSSDGARAAICGLRERVGWLTRNVLRPAGLYRHDSIDTRVTIVDTTNGRTIETLECEDLSPTDVALDADGRSLAVVGTRDSDGESRLVIWDLPAPLKQGSP